MPNWCENDLFVSGESSMRSKFLKHCINDGRLLDFNQFVPITQEILLVTKDPWGTNKNAFEVIIRETYSKFYKSLKKDTVLIKFETSWSPPLPIIMAMSKIFSDLKF